MNADDIIGQARQDLPEARVYAQDKVFIPVYNKDIVQLQNADGADYDKEVTWHIVEFQKKKDKGLVMGWSFIKILDPNSN